MTRHIGMLKVFFLVAVTLLVTAPRLWATPFSEAQIFIEINDTDGDAGIQIFVDGEGWETLQVFDPNDIQILDFTAEGSVAMQGITELHFESAEPSFEEQTLEELFALFPEGHYKFEGTTTEGQTLKGQATLTHNIPAGPEIVSPEEGEEVPFDMPVIIMWSPVTEPFPGVDSSGVIVGYQVVVEQEKPKTGLVQTFNLPADTTQVTVPPEFIQANAEYKIEVLAIEASGNQTITESDFTTE